MARSACVQGCEGARYDRLTALPPAIALLVDATLGARAAQAVARDNGLLLSHANRGWEAISELEEWKRRGAYASEAADRVLLVQERLRLMRRERRLARKRRSGLGGPEVGN